MHVKRIATKPLLEKASPRLPGERTDSSGKPVGNTLLLSIPDEEYRSLRPFLESVELPYHLSLQEPKEKIEFGYFPNTGLASFIVPLSDGRTVEVGIVGKDGFVGLILAVGMIRSPYRAIVQIRGQGMKIKAEALQSILGSCPGLQLTLHRYAQLQSLQVAQIAVCNRVHEIEQRLARWLLMCQDRVESDVIPMTQDFLAAMLGTGRPSVSLAAGILKKAGVIDYMHGTVRILNRKSLEAAACECYQNIQLFNSAVGLK